MKEYKVDQTLTFSWETVVRHFWARYPNPYSKHVRGEDVIERRILDDGSLYSKRILMKHVAKIPRWMQPFSPAKSELILEETIIDVKEKTILSLTRNIGSLTKYAVLFEHCSYKPQEEVSDTGACVTDLRSTAVSRHAWTESNWNSRFLRPLTSFLIYRYRSNALNALKGFDFVLRSVSPQTIPTNACGEGRLLEKARNAMIESKRRTAVMASGLESTRDNLSGR